MVNAPCFWEVVGGAGTGGIVVRQNREISSPETSCRLAVGSLVLCDFPIVRGRMHYQLVKGTGPQEGWVSLQLRGKDLLNPVDAQLERSLDLKASSLNFDLPRDEISITRQDLNVTALKAAFLEDGLDQRAGGSKPICPHCRLPVGEKAYTYGNDIRQRFHGECMAQRMLQALDEEEQGLREKDAKKKADIRKEYSIDWSACRDVPSNLKVVEALGVDSVPNHQCGLELDLETAAVKVVPVSQTAACINLDYLAVCLAVRRQEGIEPRFSLDAIQHRPSSIGDERLKQKKRFEPTWLARTSVGDVLFHADYYLKELSMGEHQQPVVGMQSCLDFIKDAGCNNPWTAREWYYVREAEVRRLQNGALVPVVSMGVEAREQVILTDGDLDDAPVTSSEHPLVKYAEEFTRNFDLIAERRSVVFHLRELAKAAVLAKFLGEAEVSLGQVWFDYVTPGRPEVPMQIPQLWSLRGESMLRVVDGEIKDIGGDILTQVQGVYGGVHFGLSRFNLSSISPGSAPAPLPEGRLTTLGAYNPTRTWGGEHSLPVLAPKGKFPQARVGRNSHVRQFKDLRGVDLNLDGFDLTKTKELQPEPAFDQCWANMATDSFWDMLDRPNAQDDGVENERCFLQMLFNPCLSDRRADGHVFIPPDQSAQNVQTLRSLIQNEEKVQICRQEHFVSSQFSMINAGPYFPKAWNSCFTIERRQEIIGNSTSEWFEPKSEYKDKALFLHLLRDVSPVFDKSTEDGYRFRIYRLGTLEIRTTMRNGQEQIGAVFVVKNRAIDFPPTFDSKAFRDERIVKVTEMVDRCHGAAEVSKDALGCQLQENKDVQDVGLSPFVVRYFIILETETANTMLSEMCNDGSVIWEFDPCNVEKRKYLAKVLRSDDCSGCGTTVGKILEKFPRKGARPSHIAATDRERKIYTESICGLVISKVVPQRRRHEGAHNVGANGQQITDVSAVKGNIFSKLFAD